MGRTERRTKEGALEEQSGGKVMNGQAGKRERSSSSREFKIEPVEGVVCLNRAPVLTLWVAVVAEREGYLFEEGLSFGRYIAGLFAFTKARHLGVVRQRAAKDRTKRQQELMHLKRYPVFGMQIYAKQTPDGLRAIGPDGKPIEPLDVMEYLRRRFQDKLDLVKKAMESLVCAYSPEKIGEVAYALYEKFRPSVPRGRSGWGARARLDLGCISKTLVEEARQSKKSATKVTAEEGTRDRKWRI